MAKKPVAKTKTNKFSAPTEKYARVSQADFPSISLAEAMKLPQAIQDHFAGRGAVPHRIAMAMNVSPTSSSWRMACGAAIAYGLTDGGYNAGEIKLTALGKRIVAPTRENEDAQAMIEAMLRPRIAKAFFENYNKAKFPRDDIAKNVLVDLGLPKDRADDALEILKENGDTTGVLNNTPSGFFVAMDSPAPRRHDASMNGDVEEFDATAATAVPAARPIAPAVSDAGIQRVFITHGKNKSILDQVKDIILYGKFEPVVAQEKDTVSKPVPDKVMDSMRDCQAAVIHVGSEGVMTDEAGKLHPHINGNVLIEIGAAMALYKRNFVLLIEEGLDLPSNLQGLYECRYKGDMLDSAATMKLLRTISTFK